MESFFVLLADLGIMGPGTGTTTQSPPTDVGNAINQAAGDAANGAAEMGGLGGWTWILIYGGVILVMYLLMFRPQRKREKKLKEMQSTLTTGDYIVTNAGLFGKIASIGEDCFIVEFGTNRGIRIPVLKSEVIGIREPKMTPQVVDTIVDKDKEKDKDK